MVVLTERISMYKILIISLTLAFLASPVANAQAVRIKDIADIEGVRGNQLTGYGLVVGLDGTGDTQQTLFTVQSVANMLQSFGINITGKIKVKNIAAVMITADLPPFARPGTKIDVVVSSLGDARSLQGGTLMQAPLKAANDEVYAVAQGPVSVGGFTAGGGGTTVTKNHTTVGRVPGGAIVEKAVRTDIGDGSDLKVLLRDADFLTASRTASAINGKLGDGVARAVDANTISIAIPTAYAGNAVGLIADIGDLAVEKDSPAKVVVNERTGTVVIGSAVRIAPVAIAHGSLSIEISTEFSISQPKEFSKRGSTVVVPTKNVAATEQQANLMSINGGSTIEELIAALNALKVTPRDIIAILQALKQGGALSAVLEVI